MKCLKCDKEIPFDVKVCPYCNHEIDEDDLELELPVLKKEEDIILEKTRSISPIHDNELSLIDDIQSEIDKGNDLSNNSNGIDEIGEVNVGNANVSSNGVNKVLGTKSSINKRKNILFICAILTVIVAIGIVFVTGKSSKHGTKVADVDYLEKYTQALNNYYENEEIDDVILILRSVYEDKGELEKLQSKTRITCDSWLLTYTSEKLDKREEFEEVTKKYENFLYGLNSYAIVTTKDGQVVKALLDSDYLSLHNQLDAIYEDALVFFDSLDFYNNKDYNKAYSTFEMIDNTNTYYDKAVYYMNKIVDNIMDLLIKDVEKMEKDLDSLNDDEKLTRYIDIEQIILEYDNAYVAVNLSKVESYNRMLATCREQIDTYSNKTQ